VGEDLDKQKSMTLLSYILGASPITYNKKKRSKNILRKTFLCPRAFDMQTTSRFWQALLLSFGLASHSFFAGSFSENILLNPQCVPCF
jgi:hypothetical protein